MTIFSVQPLTAIRVTAVQALVVYEDSSQPFRAPRHAFMVHALDHRDNGVHIGAGRLLTQEDQQALLDILLGETDGQDAFLTSDIVSRSTAQLAWYIPARRRAMWFRLNGRSLRLDVPWPTLVLCVRRGTLHVAALARSPRPDAGTALFHAPLMNVHASTALCHGTARLPRSWSLQDRPGYEAALFDSNFTHVNHDHTLALRDTDEVTTAHHLQFWQRIARQPPHTRFPWRALVPMEITLAQWLTGHS